MKLLAIGDPHGKLPKGLDRIVKDNQIEVIACVGDVPPVPKAFRQGKINYYPKDFEKKANKSFEDIVDKLCSYKLPVLILRGNMYLNGYSDTLTKTIFNKHKNLIYKKTGAVKIKDKEFIMFDMSFEPNLYPNADENMKKRIKEVPSRIKRLDYLLTKSKDPIIISHAPPYGILDMTPYRGNAGSKVLLDAMKKHKPRLIICGHIHESHGMQKVDSTTVYNLGSEGRYQILDV